MAVVQARLTSGGITLDQDQSLSIFSCCRNRQDVITYRDILNIEERQIGHYLLKYLDRSSRPYKVVSRVVRIAKHSRSGGTASIGASASFSSSSLPSAQLHSSSPRLSSSANAQFATSGTSLASETAEDSSDLSIEEFVMSRAYAGSHNPRSRKPVYVLINPSSGPGKARHRYEARAAPVFAAAGLKTHVETTKYSGYATEVVRDLDMSEYDTIVCVSGDGLPHEVLNGIATRPNDSEEALQHFALAQLPGGSGNAMSLSLNSGETDWAAVALGIVKGVAEPGDIMRVSQGNNVFYSFLSQSFGIVAECDLGTEDLRWMGGARFTVGIVYKCLAGNRYPCEIAYKELTPGSPTPISSSSDVTPRKPNVVTSTSNADSHNVSVSDPVPADWKVEKHPDLSMFYAGKMTYMSSDALVFPRSEPLDGAIDLLVWDTTFGSLRALSALTKFEKGTHVSSVPFYKKVSAYRLTPLDGHQYLSVDGESYACAPIQVEVVSAGARFVTPSY